MVSLKNIFFKLIRKLYRLIYGFDDTKSGLVEYSQMEGNDFIYKSLCNAESSNKGLMIAKFGTYELNSLVSYLYNYGNSYKLSFCDMLKSTCDSLDFSSNLYHLSLNAGMFPETKAEGIALCEEYRLALTKIDILSSYQLNERLIKKYTQCHFVDLDGFYAPFKYPQPWTRWLKDKKVLIVHPFIDSIKSQYENNRENLFSNPLVLPKFKKIEFIKAVQSAAGNKPVEFDTWHEALFSMEKEISQKDFDVALIGCGAYGLPLAAYVKSLGKIGIQLAGWTQMLFGVYGQRWITQQPEYNKYINKYWIRPNQSETPVKSNNIEGGCYW